MQFTTALLALAATAVALPNVGPSPHKGSAVGAQNAFWPVTDGVTVEQAKAACGNDNQIACCDDTTFTGDQVEVESGPLAGALKDLLGGKNGAKGLGLFDKCSKLNIDVIGISDLINSQCKQNIACCQGDSADSSGDLIGLNVPCVALGSLL
ncbi:Rodlet protein [Talaromyces atroroseus]|uniref:Hydrophobin n=1 Tax=Talaromyces atroroseus TaxID=1441469 RepID=A0A225B4M6_TALAT|nr:Rodlet protein [Talaromyces atroroseus]OKL64708.1 Rodlet protein [Talaromyces atroroseus]